MSNEDIALVLEPRKVLGKQVKHLRRDGFIPAVIHDHGKPSQIVMAPSKDMLKVFRQAGKFSQAIIFSRKFMRSFCLRAWRIQQFPHTQRLGRAPRLRVAAALRVRRVAVEDFGNLAEAAFVQDFFRAS